MAYKSSSESEDYSDVEVDDSDEEEIAALMAIEKEKKRRNKSLAKSNGEEDEEDEEEDEEQEEEAIYNTEALHEKLEEIGWTEEQTWNETLAITTDAPTEVDDVDDDLGRELAFYNQALSATKEAVKRFEDAGIVWKRPADYLAEMVKSDEHMARVKEQLVYETKVIEDADERRKTREIKKFSKHVEAEKKKERAQGKKKAISDISALRKRRQKEGFEGELDVDAELQRFDSSARKKGKLGERFQSRDKSAKRASRDSKYGFGGPKRLSKQNDAYSAADGDYKQGRSSSGGGRGRGRGKPANRPGKSRRQAMANKR